jgi:hypothetical protein
MLPEKEAELRVLEERLAMPTSAESRDSLQQLLAVSSPPIFANSGVLGVCMTRQRYSRR